MTPMTSGVVLASWVLRSRFSTAAPPTSAPSGQVGAEPVDGARRAAGSEGSTVGTAWIRTTCPAVAAAAAA